MSKRRLRIDLVAIKDSIEVGDVKEIAWIVGGGREKESPEEEGRDSRKEKFLVREVKGLRAQPELQQAFV